jgi:hypothetical protein
MRKGVVLLIDLASSYIFMLNFQTNMFSPHPVRGLKLLNVPFFYYLKQ